MNSSNSSSFEKHLPVPGVTGLVVVGLVGLATGLLLHFADSFSLVFYGDAAAHLVRARQLVDSAASLEETLGTVWLPMGHILLVPFVAVDSLFYSGTAAILPGVLLLAGTTGFLAALVHRHTRSLAATLMTLCAFGFNPNILYLTTTPMSEAVLLFFFAGAVDLFSRWLEEPSRLHLLSFAGLLAACATLSRYEAWMLPPVMTSLTLWRIRGWDRPLHKGRIWIAIALAYAGIVVWGIWNLYYYGDASRFVGDTYLAGSTQARSLLRQAPWEVFRLYGKATVDVFGPFLLLLCCLGCFFLARHRRWPLLILLAVPALFTIVAMMFGYVQMDKWGWNVRYATILAPLCAVGAGMTAGWMEQCWRAGAWVLPGSVVVLYGFLAVSSDPGVVTYNDAVRQFRGTQMWATDAGRALGSRYQGGGVALLTGHGQGVRLMIPSSVHLRDFGVVMTRKDSVLATEPWISHRYAVIALHPEPDGQWYTNPWLSNLGTLLHHFSILHANPDYLVLERRSPRVVYE